MKPPASDPLAMLEHIDGLISQWGEIADVRAAAQPAAHRPTNNGLT
jgi:hypothetical protein